MTDEPTADARVLTPPYPNLGPEPWPESSSPGLGWAGAGLGLTVVLLALAWRRRRRRPGSTRPPDRPAETLPDGDDDRSRLVRASAVVREALARRLGPSGWAQTTEEVAASLAADEDVPPDLADRLVGLLREADLAKFRGAPSAGVLSGPNQSPDWEALAAAIARELPAAGASSTTIGK